MSVEQKHRGHINSRELAPQGSGKARGIEKLKSNDGSEPEHNYSSVNFCWLLAEKCRPPAFQIILGTKLNFKTP